MKETETPKTKVCADCGKELPLEEFGKNFRSKDGYNNICRECKGKRYKKGDKGSEETKTESKSTNTTKLTDKELVEELRARGWEVKATKTIEL